MTQMADETGLGKNAANYTALSPLSHLVRANQVFPDREAVVYGQIRHSWADVYRRVSQLASALTVAGVTPGDVVAVLCPNTPTIFEAHFGVPATRGVLNTINTRLDTATVTYILEHGEAKILIVDSEFLPLAEAAINAMREPRPLIIESADQSAGFPASGRHTDYEAFIAGGDPAFAWLMPEDEWDSISLSYTSGTTGRPKGVVYHHRGAYLMTMGNSISWQWPLYLRYLAIVPLFHCNGWTHTWAIPMQGGTMVCCRNVTAKAIFDAIADEGVTHFGGAPIVLNMLVNADATTKRPLPRPVYVVTAGAPPPAATLLATEKLGFEVMQVYGLTETYGPATECIWDNDKWGNLDDAGRADIKARTGVYMPAFEDIDVVDQDSRQPVPRDGQTAGEIVIRGNGVMKGYYKDPEATKQAFEGGYFRSGDIAFRHLDGYIKITDRLKDVIISGGENISSVEVEGVIMHHNAVSLCAVVARPDEKWGETPCAFIELKDGETADQSEIIACCRQRLAGFKTPKTVMFMELPKTSTGKIQKFVLRKLAKELD